VNKTKSCHKNTDNVDQSPGQLSLFEAWLDPTSPDHSRTLEVYDALPKFSLGRERESTKNLREWNNVAIGNNRVVRVTMSAAILKTSALPGDPDGEVQGRVIFPGVREELVDKALRKMADDALAHFRQSALFHHDTDPFPATLSRQPLQPRPKLQIFAHAHIKVERVIFRHVTDAPPDLLRFLENVQPRDARRPGRRGHVTRENAHRRALAGAIWAEQPRDFPFPNRE